MSWQFFAKICCCALAGLCLTPAWARARARADVQRFAIVVGNNRGRPEDEPLRYAIGDAERVYAALHELGGFQVSDMVLLRDEPPDSLRRTLSSFAERIRVAPAGSLLVLYFTHRLAHWK